MAETIVVVKQRGLDFDVAPGAEQLAKALDGEVETRDRDRGAILNSIEWLAAATVAAYIAKPFFDELLKQLGKEAGTGIANALKKLFQSARDADDRVFNRDEVQQQITALHAGDSDSYASLRARTGRHLPPLEVIVQLPSNASVEQLRFVFPAAISLGDWDTIMLGLAETCRAALEARPDASGIGSVRLPRRSYVFDPETRQWWSDLDLAHRAHARQGRPSGSNDR